METVYIVMTGEEADDSYYADYDYVYGVYTTEEKAKRVVDLILKKHADDAPRDSFANAWYYEAALDDMSEFEP